MHVCSRRRALDDLRDACRRMYGWRRAATRFIAASGFAERRAAAAGCLAIAAYFSASDAIGKAPWNGDVENLSSGPLTCCEVGLDRLGPERALSRTPTSRSPVRLAGMIALFVLRS